MVAMHLDHLYELLPDSPFAGFYPHQRDIIIPYSALQYISYIHIYVPTYPHMDPHGKINIGGSDNATFLHIFTIPQESPSKKKHVFCFLSHPRGRLMSVMAWDNMKFP